MTADETLDGPVETRFREADRVVDARQCTPDTTDGLFGVVDLLNGNVALRRVLTDPAYSPQRRSALVHSLFDGKIDAGAVDIVAQLAAQRWSSGSAFVGALERAGVRSELHAALDAGVLDAVEDELFRFSRIVAGDSALRAALDDRRAQLSAREGVVRDLLAGRVHPATSRLARRAVRAHQRTVELTLEHYLQLAAQVRHRMVARVTVARPMSPEQEERLRAALSRQQGRSVDIQLILDPSVLGGVKVELGDNVIDGTVQRRLDDVTRQLS